MSIEQAYEVKDIKFFNCIPFLEAYLFNAELIGYSEGDYFKLKFLNMADLFTNISRLITGVTKSIKIVIVNKVLEKFTARM